MTALLPGFRPFAFGKLGPFTPGSGLQGEGQRPCLGAMMLVHATVETTRGPARTALHGVGTALGWRKGLVLEEEMEGPTLGVSVLPLLWKL